jgi:hypothetical protein
VNPDVRYRPQLGLYQIFAESSMPDGKLDIFYYSSVDGLHWDMRPQPVIEPQGNEVAVRTATSHPDTSAWVYFGRSADPSALGNSISWTSWS